MRVRVENIPPAGQRVEAGLGEVWAFEAARDALDRTPSELRAVIRLGGPKDERVPVEVALSVSAPSACDRCASELTLRVQVESSLDYVPEPPAAAVAGDDEDGVELEEADLDVGWYQDGHLDLAAILTEAIALAIPSRVVCDDEPACDARTESLLASARSGPVGHPAFAALKNLPN